MSGALSLALTPAPVVLAVTVCAVLPRTAGRRAALSGIVGLLLTLALLIVDALPGFGGARVLVSYGQALPGIPYLFRADSIAMLVAFTTVIAALLVLAQPRWGDPRSVAGLLTCVTGSLAAAFAGNAVMLFAGLEVANIGTFALLTSRGRRPGRGAVIATLIEHAGALSLLAAAANLQAASGTSDFSALPVSALTPAVAVPWAIAAMVRLLAPAVTPLRGTRAPTAAWAATAAVPAGIVTLVRLSQVGGTSLPQVVTLTLAIGGGAAALAGAVAALRRGPIEHVGRGLCSVAAGTVLAVAGFAQGVTTAAVAAGLGFLELTVAMSAAWEGRARSGGQRAAAAGALLAAGALPVGFGTTALVLELASTVGHGVAVAPLLLVLTLAAAAAAVAAVQAARVVLRQPADASLVSRWPPPVAIAALGASAAGAVVPGAATAWLGGVLGRQPLLLNAGAAAAAGPGGGWAGGYFLVAGLVLAATVLSAASLAGRSPLLSGQAAVASADGAPSPVPLRVYRGARRPALVILRRLPAVDAWLAQQPQLPLVAAGSLLAVILVR